MIYQKVIIILFPIVFPESPNGSSKTKESIEENKTTESVQNIELPAEDQIVTNPVDLLKFEEIETKDEIQSENIKEVDQRKLTIFKTPVYKRNYGGINNFNTEELKTFPTLKNLDEKFNHNDFNVFLNWWDRALYFMTDFCKTTTGIPYNNHVQIEKEIRMLPKCMMHLTRKLCNCDSKCVTEISENFEFDDRCPLFDLENVETDDSYIELCKKYDLVPENGKMVQYVSNHNKDQNLNEFQMKINELCDDSTKFSDTQCIAYKLRDISDNDPNYLFTAIYNTTRKDCDNEEYFEQVGDIYQTLGFSLNKDLDIINPNLKRSYRSIIGDSFFEHPFNMTDVNKLEISEITTSSSFDNICTAAPITAMGVVLMGILGYLSLKNRNDCFKFGFCLTGGCIVMLSLVFYLLSEMILK